MERLRSIEITVVIDTNKHTYKDEFALAEDETVLELLERVKAVVETRVESF